MGSGQASGRRAGAGIKAMSRRILYIWLPRLQTDRLAIGNTEKADHHRPVVIFDKKQGAMLVEAVNLAAHEARLRPGMTLAEARALVPDVVVHPADPAADQNLLTSLARALERYTPLVALDPPDGLVLDIAGCAHLFGGEGALVATLRHRCARHGLHAIIAVADTPAVSWALSHYANGGIVPEGENLSAVRELPVASMRLPAETVAVMQRLGLKTVAQVLAQPRAPLAQRFGPLVGRRIDQMAGLEEEPITPLTPASPHVFDRAFAEPVSHIEALEAGLGQLAATLTRSLQPRGLGARRIHLRLFHADGAVRDIMAGASEPLDDPGRIVRLMTPRLREMSTRIETDSGVDLMRIYAGELEPVPTWQGRLGEVGDMPRELAALVDTLSERLGAAAVYRLEPVDTHQPGQQTRKIPARHAHGRRFWEAERRGRPAREGPLRPLRLLDPPEPIETVAGVPDGPPLRFLWRRVFYHVSVAEGPERIAPEWWREESGDTCDYFRVEDREGRRFWLFRKGLFVRETAAPRWFLHGFFG